MRRVLVLVAAVQVGAGLGAAVSLGLSPKDPRALPEWPVTAADLRIQAANNSPVLAADPTRRGFLVLAGRVDNPSFGCSLHVSTDGGRAWVAAPGPALPPGVERCYEPEVGFGPDGALYYLFAGLRGPDNERAGVFLAASTDRARTFGDARLVLEPNHSLVRLAIDASTGPSGRLHLAGLRTAAPLRLGRLPPVPVSFGLPDGPNPIVAAFSDDGGRNFSPATAISDPARQAMAPALAVARGQVYVAYHDLRLDAAGNRSLVVTTSADGGRRFGPEVVVDDRVVPPEQAMATVASALPLHTLAPPSLVAGEGRAYLGWHDGRNGDWDVFVRSSPDGGRTWDGPHRVNDDKVGNGRHQSLPQFAMAPSGRIDAVFYDRRGDRENYRNHVYYTSSTDHGRSFAPNMRLTAEASDSRIGQRYPVRSGVGLIEFVDVGSRLGLVSARSRQVAAWADTRNAEVRVTQDLFAARVERHAQTASRWALLGGVAGGLASLAWWAAARRWPRRVQARHSAP